jgi:hypothetical protein
MTPGAQKQSRASRRCPARRLGALISGAHVKHVSKDRDARALRARLSATWHAVLAARACKGHANGRRAGARCARVFISIVGTASARMRT